MNSLPLFNIGAGAALLLFGRRLFWLFVACVGFIVGVTAATDWLGLEHNWVTVAVALGLGVLGAVVAVFLQRLVVAFAGFLAGGYLAYMLALGLRFESAAWIAYLVGGVLGALLVLGLFNWALIGLSTLMGATVIVQALPLEHGVSALFFAALTVLGIVAQAMQLKRTKPPPKGAKS